MNPHPPFRRRPFRASLALAAFLGSGLATPLLADGVEVRLTLPVRARIDLSGVRTIAPLPFIMVSQEGEGRIPGRDIDVQAEFERYLVKLLRRETDLKIIDPGPVQLPTYDLDLLSRDRDFWRALGERLQADLILAGSLDFDIQDRSGYRTEEYTSPFDGRIYRRQVLVEETGFEYDIVMQVYDGRTGELLHSDNFKDFKQYEGESADPLVGMFSNLYALEDRIVGIFAQKSVQATRVLFAN
ncbi:MAG: hypothetical protein D6696_18675 [Acidobacteria bacterium]|nr:MAG: hypothetical protein D6696_18675 [Acidobacteriota bacterium]